MVEQRTFNPSVLGSNPSALTIDWWRKDANIADLTDSHKGRKSEKRCQFGANCECARYSERHTRDPDIGQVNGVATK